MNSSSFHIYNASAGSGKTFTLVKEYLKVLFKSSNKEPYKNILAITFTNKAVGEMKERIIETLKEFSSEDILVKSNSMFDAICEELPIQPKLLHDKSKRILNSIVHNYAAFDISTIDKFTQKLIRTFAYDLRLPMNFEVELDTESLLNEAVDNLIAKAGSDKELTKTLIDFAVEKADDDKSWDISLDFYKIAKLLTSENDIPFIETLKDKSLEDFKTLKSILKEKIKSTEDLIIKEAQGVLALIEECGLEFSDFSRSSLPKHFENLFKKNFDIKFDSNWQIDLIEGNALYPKRATEDVASTINEIQPQLVLAFKQTKQNVFQLKFLKNFYKNCTPLSVLNSIHKELESLKKERNVILISEFNSIISNAIKNQPVPFIYERIGEKFRHYFIDEFQDTSVMQWENLIPLLDNSLSSENGSVMLVGDAKQAIYRWRGGKAEQFIGLYNDENPFFTEKENRNLPNNYRSFEGIIDFNNSFFKHLSTFGFSKSEYGELYKQSTQNASIEKEGYVNLTFLDLDKDENRDEAYPKKVSETIKNCLKNGFQFKDICILVRKKKEGVAIADYLNNEGVDIISSETLLLSRSPEVEFIVNILKYVLEPHNNEVKILVLNFLSEHKLNIADKHLFYNTYIKLEIDQVFKGLNKFGIHFNYNEVLQLPVYEAAENIIYSFNLVETSNAYVQFFLDFVLDYLQKDHSSLSDFIEHYHSKKDDLSIISPQEKNAVQIMTIHKSKGLEFPVVIFPYADLNIYKELEPKEWFPLDAEKYHGFSYALLNYNKDLENFGETGQQIYTKHQAELELDNINLLYVALTRPIEQLHVISNKQADKKGNENLKLFSGLFINYLKHIDKWEESTTSYSFGNPKKTSSTIESTKVTIEQERFISTPKKEHNIKIVANSGYLWDTNQQKAIEKGNLIHYIMSQIKTKIDVGITFERCLATGIINSVQAKELKQIVIKIVEHPKLSNYFNSDNTIYNERDIITKEGISLRPDRLVINTKNEVIIIDYKTGESNKEHAQQLQIYQDALEDMNFLVAKKLLIYINDDIELKEV
ncbi:MAG: UvrD-helicase domain-containing protein [Flavobacteriaceae bacterium]|nr:UvrD-helicase domain-containing protein [Flavobacteriaceae bacterium]